MNYLIKEKNNNNQPILTGKQSLANRKQQISLPFVLL
jgi:hypothetical protein